MNWLVWLYSGNVYYVEALSKAWQFRVHKQENSGTGCTVDIRENFDAIFLGRKASFWAGKWKLQRPGHNVWKTRWLSGWRPIKRGQNKFASDFDFQRCNCAETNIP